jgi:hypothetical protein
VRLGRPVGPASGDDRPLVAEIDVEDPGLLADVSAERLRVAQQQVVELRPDDLEGQVALVRDVPVEAPSGVGRAVDVDEAHARLADEAVLHLVQDPQILEHPVTEREHRFADVLAGEAVTLEDRHHVTLPGQQRRHGRTGRSSPDDEHIGLMVLHHALFHDRLRAGAVVVMHPQRARNGRPLGRLKPASHAHPARPGRRRSVCCDPFVSASFGTNDQL